MVAQTKRRVAEQHRKVVLELYAGGHTLARIARITGQRVETIEVMLRKSGVVVDEQRRTKPKELEAMTEGSKRFNLEETLERVEAYAPLFKDDTLEQRIERHELTMTKLCEKGAIEEYAEDRNLSYTDAFEEISTRISEVSDTYRRKREEHAAALELARELGEDPPPSPEEQRRMLAEEEREMFGFTNDDVEARARSKSISYREALDQLTHELEEKELAKRAKEEQRRLEEFYAEYDRQLEEEEL